MPQYLQEDSRIMFEEYMFEKQKMNLGNLTILEKKRASNNPVDQSNKFLGILDMGSVSSRKREMNIW